LGRGREILGAMRGEVGAKGCERDVKDERRGRNKLNRGYENGRIRCEGRAHT